MKKIIEFLRRISIKKRLFIFVLMPLILMIICFLLYYSYSRDVLFEKSAQASKQRIAMAENSLSLNAVHLEEGFDEYCQVLPSMVVSHQEAAFHEEARKQMEVLGADGIVVYDEEGTLLFQEGNQRFPPKIKEQIDQVGFGWLFDDKSNDIILGKEVFFRGERIAKTYAIFRKEVFAPSFIQMDSNDMALVVTDQNQKVLFGQGPINPGVVLAIEDGELTLGMHTFYVQSRNIASTNWMVQDLVSKDYVYEELLSIRNMLMLYSCASLIILFLFSSIFYHSIYDPISAILTSMHDFSEDNLDQMMVRDVGKDEIHDLNVNFNELLVRIDELLKTIQSEQEQRRETQFQLLQAQINPHFLFNTLNTLRYLAILNEDKPVSEGIGALSKLLRNTIVDSNELVSIQEEIENVKSYIVIQKLRYGDIFETVYNIDEEVKYCHILKFLLQPIVENSILHAFEEDREHQILTIRVRSSGGCLKIEVGDNGKGFQLEEEKVNKKLSGIGMKNIQDRIQLMYGGTYRMEVHSVLNVGTITTLYLPLQ